MFCKHSGRLQIFVSLARGWSLCRLVSPLPLQIAGKTRFHFVGISTTEYVWLHYPHCRPGIRRNSFLAAESFLCNDPGGHADGLGSPEYCIVLLALAVVCIRVVITRAQPILRTRVIETLSARFKSRVELAELHVWVADGVHVDGKGLKIYGTTDPNPWEAGVQPLLEIGEFRFQTALRSLFREPMHVDIVYVDDMIVNIPPTNDRQEMAGLRQQGRKMRMSIAVDRFVCADTKLIINTPRAEQAAAGIRYQRSADESYRAGPAAALRCDADQSQASGRHPVDGPVRTSKRRKSARHRCRGQLLLHECGFGNAAGHRWDSVVHRKIWGNAGTH